MLRATALLHFIVLIWGLTSVIGKLIHLPAFTLVAWRTGIAAVALVLILRVQRAVLPDRATTHRLLASGLLIGTHWYLFFLATHTGGPSACLTGVSTMALWTALLEPVFTRTFRWRALDALLAVIVSIGVTLAVSGDSRPSTLNGVLIGIVAALFAAIFSLINVRFVQRISPMVISLYQMTGAALLTTACAFLLAPPGSPVMPGTAAEWAWLLVLSLGCTVFAYAAAVALLKKISAFSMSLVANLEPVYGMTLAVLILGSDEIRSAQFYLGSAIIIACVVLHPFLTRQAIAAPPLRTPDGKGTRSGSGAQAGADN